MSNDGSTLSLNPLSAAALANPVTAPFEISRMAVAGMTPSATPAAASAPGANAPAAAAPAAPTDNSAAALANLPTQITIQGRQFELRNMSVQSAQEMYALFSPADQERTQRLAGFIQNFRAPLASELPAELQEPGRLEEFIGHLQQGGGRVLDSAPQWSRNLYNSAMNAASNAPGADQVRAIVGAVQTTASTVNGGINALGEARDWMMLPPRALAYAITRGREWWQSSNTPPTPEQAMAVATGYQGALIASRREAGFFDKAWSYVEAGWEWLSHSAVGTYVSAFCSGVGSLVRGEGFHAGWQSTLDNARNNPEPQRSRDDILNQNLEQRDQAIARFRNAERIADRYTTPIADTMQSAGENGSALYSNYNNEVNRVQENGQSNPILQPNGTPVTMRDVNAGRGHEIFGNIGRNGVWPAAAGFTMGAAIPGRYVAQGFARGRITNYENAAANLRNTDEALRLRQWHANAAGETAEAERLGAQRAAASARATSFEETAAARRAAAGEAGGANRTGFTQNALNQVEVEGARGPRLPFGRWFQGLGEGAHNLSLGTRTALVEAPVAARAATAAVASAPAATANLWTRLRGGLGALRGTGGGGGRFGAVARVGSLGLGALSIVGIAAAPLDSAMAATDARSDAERNDRGTDAAIQTGGAVAAGGALLRLGLTRATPFLSPIVEGTNLTSAVVRGDNHTAVASGSRLATIGGFTAAGAALGTPFFGVGAIPGALGGMTVGGIVVAADYIYGMFNNGNSVSERVATAVTGPTQTQLASRAPAAPAPSRDGAAGAADPGLAAAAVDQAIAARNAARGMANPNVTGGSTMTLAEFEAASNGNAGRLPAPVSAANTVIISG